MTEANDQCVLRGIDQLAWADFNHAYGPATDVPGLLRALSSPSKEARADAWDGLYGTLWHQGTIYEATSYAIPFLIQLLEARQVLDKERIVSYLSMLFNGQGYWEVHGEYHWPDSPPEAQLKQIVTQEKSWQEATRSAIRVGEETYLGLLQKGNTRTRLAAAYLLGLMGVADLEIVDEILKEEF